MTHICRHCQHNFPSERQRRIHPCPNRDVALRAGQLRWPTEPVAKLLMLRFGEYDATHNKDGYCAATVQRYTGIVASTWLKAERGDGLTDAQADHIAVALGVHHARLWPGWHNALDVTDADMAWLAAWSHGAVA